MQQIVFKKKRKFILIFAQVRTSIPISGSDKFSVLQRRLGVIVGAGVGVFVFIILMIILTCVKFKKRRISRQLENGKVDPRVQDALTTTNTVGTLGSYHGHHHNNHHNHNNHNNHNNTNSQYHHNTITRLGNGNGNGNGSSPGHMSPEFLTYRHYSIATDSGFNSASIATTELERL